MDEKDNRVDCGFLHNRMAEDRAGILRRFSIPDLDGVLKGILIPHRAEGNARGQAVRGCSHNADGHASDGVNHWIVFRWKFS